MNIKHALSVMIIAVLLAIFILIQPVIMINTAFATGPIHVSSTEDPELASAVEKLGLGGTKKTAATPTPPTPTTIKPSIIKSFANDLSRAATSYKTDAATVTSYLVDLCGEYINVHKAAQAAQATATYTKEVVVETATSVYGWVTDTARSIYYTAKGYYESAAEFASNMISFSQGLWYGVPVCAYDEILGWHWHIPTQEEIDAAKRKKSMDMFNVHPSGGGRSGSSSSSS